MMNGMTNKAWPWDDLEIGTVFNNGETELEVVEDELGCCSGCYFNISRVHCEHFKCGSRERADQKNVIFVDIKFKDRLEAKKSNNKRILNRSQIIELIKQKYAATNNELYKELLDEI